MKNRGLPGKLALVGIGGCLLLAITCPWFVRAQSYATEDWEKAAGGKMSFEVVSVKQNTSGGTAVNRNRLDPLLRFESLVDAFKGKEEE
jgi:hypothetical protein